MEEWTALNTVKNKGILSLYLLEDLLSGTCVPSCFYSGHPTSQTCHPTSGLTPLSSPEGPLPCLRQTLPCQPYCVTVLIWWNMFSSGFLGSREAGKSIWDVVCIILVGYSITEVENMSPGELGGVSVCFSLAELLLRSLLAFSFLPFPCPAPEVSGSSPWTQSTSEMSQCMLCGQHKGSPHVGRQDPLHLECRSFSCRKPDSFLNHSFLPSCWSDVGPLRSNFNFLIFFLQPWLFVYFLGNILF